MFPGCLLSKYGSILKRTIFPRAIIVYFNVFLLRLHLVLRRACFHITVIYQFNILFFELMRLLKPLTRSSYLQPLQLFSGNFMNIFTSKSRLRIDYIPGQVISHKVHFLFYLQLYLDNYFSSYRLPRLSDFIIPPLFKNLSSEPIQYPIWRRQATFDIVELE